MTARWLAKSSSVRLGCGSGLCRVMNPGMHLRTNQETLNTITTEPYTVKIEVQVLLTHLCTLKLLLSFILCTVITSSIVIHVTIIMITIITRLYHYCYCRNTTCIIMCVYIDTYIHLYIYICISLSVSLYLSLSPYLSRTWRLCCQATPSVVGTNLKPIFVLPRDLQTPFSSQVILRFRV